MSTFEEKLKESISKMESLLGEFDTFANKYEQFVKEWELDASKFEACKSLIINAKNEMKSNEKKLMRDTLKCVVFGRISTGKSALINALLTKRILPSLKGPTTNSFVEIKKSMDGTNHAIFPKTPDVRRDIACLNVVDEMSDDKIKEGSHVDLFYSSQECPLLDNDVVLVDTPGIETNINMDDAIKEECEDADVLILLVSAESGLGESEKNFISKYTTEFSKLNLLIVFNKWEEIHSQNASRCAQIEKKYRNVARDYLCQYLHVEEGDVANRVHFISAEERLSIIDKVSGGNVASGRDVRNEMFETFLGRLKMSLSETSTRRKLSILKINLDALIATYKGIKRNLTEKTALTKSVEEKMNKLVNFNETINTEVVSSFKASYQPFFVSCLNIVKMEQVKKGMSVQDKLKCLIDKTVVETMKSLKRNIIDSLKGDESDKKIYIKILNELYFPFHLDITEKVKAIKMDELEKAILEIIWIKKKGTALSIASVAVSGAIIATGGNVNGIRIPTKTAIDESAFGTACRYVVTDDGGQISTVVFTFERDAFRTFYENDEAIIKKWWEQISESLSNSFNKFLPTISEKIDNIHAPIDKDIEVIKTYKKGLEKDLAGLRR